MWEAGHTLIWIQMTLDFLMIIYYAETFGLLYSQTDTKDDCFCLLQGKLSEFSLPCNLQGFTKEEQYVVASAL